MESTYVHALLKKTRHMRGASRRVSAAGFTLVEMMVVLAIIIMIVSIVILSQGAFNRSLLLTDTTYSIALSIRQAQTYGISSVGFGTSIYNAGYGVDFTTANTGGYEFFADVYPAGSGSSLGGLCPGHSASSGPEARPGDCLWTSSSENVNAFVLSDGFTISKFCGTTAGNVERCYAGASSGHMTVSFLRPNTDTVIIGTLSGGGHESYVKGVIDVTSPDGQRTECVVVTQTGQITVSSNCP